MQKHTPAKQPHVVTLHKQDSTSKVYLTYSSTLTRYYVTWITSAEF